MHSSIARVLFSCQKDLVLKARKIYTGYKYLLFLQECIICFIHIICSQDNIGTYDESEEDEGIDLKDEFCDPENPVKIHFQDVSAAAFKIRNGIQRTPCQVS